MKKLVLLVMLAFSTSFFAQDFKGNDSLVNQEKLFEKIKILPNPTSEILFIRNGEDISSYQLVNMNGMVVQKSKNNPQIISLIDEEIGMYFLIIEIQGIFKTYRVQKY